MPPRALVAPDSFKGTHDAPAVAAALARGLESAGWEADAARSPTAARARWRCSCEALGGELVEARASDPLGRPVDCRFGLVDGGATAIVETAQASGLGLVAAAERDAWRRLDARHRRADPRGGGGGRAGDLGRGRRQCDDRRRRGRDRRDPRSGRRSRRRAPRRPVRRRVGVRGRAARVRPAEGRRSGARGAPGGAPGRVRREPAARSPRRALRRLRGRAVGRAVGGVRRRAAGGRAGGARRARLRRAAAAAQLLVVGEGGLDDAELRRQDRRRARAARRRGRACRCARSSG